MKLVNQIVLSAVALFAAADICFAQTYSLTPDDTIQLTGVFEDLQTLSIQQENISGSAITLKWKKVSESVPALWDALVCDNVQCYSTLLDSGTMYPVLPADYGFVLLHITPHINYGTAVVRYEVWDVANAAIKDTLTYILTVDSASGINETQNKILFKVFPNPSNDKINIIANLNSGFTFSVSDLSGKEILNGISKTNLISLSTKYFANGVYNILIGDKNKIISIRKIILQH